MAISIYKSYGFTFWQPLPPSPSNKEASNPKNVPASILETEKKTKSGSDLVAKPQVDTLSPPPVQKGKFICPVEACSKLFLKKCGLKTHLLLKHKEETKLISTSIPSEANKGKNYQCSVGDCQSSYARKSDLSQHLKSKHRSNTPDTTLSNTHSPSLSAEEMEEAAFTLANLEQLLLPTEKI